MAACLLTALLPAVLLAGSEVVPRLTFAQLVDSIRADSDVTQTIKSYGGKEVEIRGFIIPAGPPDLSFFMLSRVSALAGQLLLRGAGRPGRDRLCVRRDGCDAAL